MDQPYQTLEQRTESSDWKQWIPVYGMYKAVADARAGKPSIAENLDGDHTLRFFLSGFYHAITTSGITVGAIETVGYLTKQGYL